MTDRELLELAAKAAGYGLHWLEEEQAFYGYFPAEIRDDDYPWNPLTDDGDALRLAVKLGVEVYQYYDSAAVLWKGDEIVEYYKNNNDPYAATRRAIVRAGAEIGKGME
jgi:hypothetical protein